MSYGSKGGGISSFMGTWQPSVPFALSRAPRGNQRTDAVEAYERLFPMVPTSYVYTIHTHDECPHSNAVAFLVTLQEPADRTVRVNITLPERLLRRIDERATNRSAFLARAAEKALAES
jgi:hypothetical protein